MYPDNSRSLNDGLKLGLDFESCDNPLVVLNAILNRQLTCVDMDTCMDFAIKVADHSVFLMNLVECDGLTLTAKHVVSHIFVHVLKNLPYDLIDEFLSPYNDAIVAFMVNQIVDECHESDPGYIPFFVNVINLYLEIYARGGSEMLLEKFLLPGTVTSLSRSLAVHVIDKAAEIRSEPRLTLEEFNVAFQPQKCCNCDETKDNARLRCGHGLCRKCFGRRAVIRGSTCPACNTRLC